MKKFKDWVAENTEFGDNNLNSKYHNKNAGEKGNDNQYKNQEQLKSFSVFKEPKNGDRMYSVYGGKKFVGIFVTDRPNGTKEKVGKEHMGAWYPDHLKEAVGVRMSGHLMFPPLSGIVYPFRVHETGTLSVGYEGPIVWDQKEGMFYAPADSD